MSTAKYRAENREKIAEGKRKHYAANREKVAKACRRYYLANREKVLEQAKRYHAENRDKNIVYLKEYYIANREKITKQNREYVLANREKTSAYHKQWRHENSDALNTYIKHRRSTDPGWRLKMVLSGRIRHALKRYLNGGTVKAATTSTLMGCDVDWLVAWLEVQFKPGMTWSNYGNESWHVDHIRPCSKFDLNDPDQQKRCFHWTNLQPLWAEENLSKSDRYEEVAR